MTYLIWVLPALLVVGALASGRVGTLRASGLGVVAALAVTLASAPIPFGWRDAALAMARGAWTGWIVVPYIFGGVLFWQVALRPGKAVMPVETTAPEGRARRRLLFSACFLIGPFAESATGFGVGIVGTMALVRRLGIAPTVLLPFGLLSQTLILWGGMGNGVIVGAAFARTDPTALALDTSPFLVAYHVFWLPLFWQMADRAGFPAGWRGRSGEAAWIASGLAAVIAATWLLGPEAAMLAAYGPLIVLRYVVDERPGRARLARDLRRMLPFALLIAWLAATRLLPALGVLREVWRVQPFLDGPAWAPMFHAGTWLIVAAMLTGLPGTGMRGFGQETGRAWAISRLAIMTVMAFAVMAELLSGSGIAAGLANGLYGAFGRSAIGLTSFMSALFGALANTGSAPNALFMSSQISLARAAGRNVAAVVALQYAGALSLNLISPVRMSIVCGLAGIPGQERAAWCIMLPFTAAVLLVLLVAAMAICGGVI